MKIEDWSKLGELGFISINNNSWMKGKNKYVKKICEGCGKPFLSQNGLGKYCDKKCSGLKRKTTDINELRLSFENEGYTLLTNEYNHNKQKLWFVCPNNHTHYTHLSNWKRGHRCGYCTGKYRLYIPDVIKAIESEGYSIVTENIKNSKQKLHLKCPNDNDFYVSWDNWKSKHIRCTCNSSSSSPENELYEFLKDYKPLKHYKILKNQESGRYLELDIFFPSMNKAIEFNGDYWHCNPNKYDANYYHKQMGLYAHEIWQRDEQKKFLCMSNNIDLMTIWEDEWKYNNINVKNSLLTYFKGVQNC
jgi:hypothetical protein